MPRRMWPPIALPFGPVLARQEFIDDRDLRPVGGIAFAEVTAGAQRDLHGGQVAGIDVAPVGDRGQARPLVGVVAFNGQRTGIDVAAEGQGIGGAGGGDAGDGADILQQRTEEVAQLSVLLVARARQGELRGLDVLRLEAGVNGEQAGEAEGEKVRCRSGGRRRAIPGRRRARNGSKARAFRWCRCAPWSGRRR